MTNKTADVMLVDFAEKWAHDPAPARELLAEASRQLYEATMEILESSRDEYEVRAAIRAFYGITETEEEASNGY